MNERKGLESSYWKVLAVGLAVLLAAGVSAQGLVVSESVNNFLVRDSQEAGNWTVYFNSTEASSLDFELVEGSGSVSLSEVSYFDGTNWNPVTVSDTGSGSWQVDWNGNGYGRAVFDVDSFGSYRVNISSGDRYRVVGNPGRAEQNDLSLDLGNPVVDYTLCSFSSGFWECNPEKTEEGVEPGYSGEVLELDPGESRNFTVPNSSTVTGFSMVLESTEDEAIKVFRGGEIEFADITGNSLSDVLSAENQEISAYSSDKTWLWNYSTNYDVKDMEAGDHQVVSGEDEIAVATKNSLLLLSQHGNELWRRTGYEYTGLSSGEVSSEARYFSEDDGEPDSFTCIGCGSTNATRFNIPYSFQDSEGTFYVTSALGFYNKTGDLKFKLNGT
ncbi:MAG: hypothetical protein ABEJ93_01495, partial [Candidatus Nanohalobium sp.]